MLGIWWFMILLHSNHMLDRLCNIGCHMGSALSLFHQIPHLLYSHCAQIWPCKWCRTAPEYLDSTLEAPTKDLMELIFSDIMFQQAMQASVRCFTHAFNASGIGHAYQRPHGAYLQRHHVSASNAGKSQLLNACNALFIGRPTSWSHRHVIAGLLRRPRTEPCLEAAAGLAAV